MKTRALGSVAVLVWVAFGAATGAPAGAAGRSAGLPAALVATRGTPPASVELRFVLSLLTEARLQLALANALQGRRASGPVGAIADEANGLWADVETQLEDAARDLHIALPTGAGAGEQRLLARFGHLNDAAFERAYLEALERSDTVALDRMESLDALIDPRLLFFADREVPRFLTLRTIVESRLAR